MQPWYKVCCLWQLSLTQDLSRLSALENRSPVSCCLCFWKRGLFFQGVTSSFHVVVAPQVLFRTFAAQKVRYSAFGF